MSLALNTKQLEKLADFAFEIAKGLLLGSAGLVVAGSTEQRIIFPFFGMLASLGFVRMGLILLKE